MNEPPAGPPDESVGERTFREDYDWAATSPLAAVVETVADAADREQTDLPSLHSAVDPDALDALFGQVPRESGRGPVRLSFSYADREVVVESDGSVVVASRREVD